MAKKRRPNSAGKQPQTKTLMPAAAALVTAIPRHDVKYDYTSTALTASNVTKQAIVPVNPQLFTLNVENNPGSPSLRFTWCLSPEATQIL